MLQTKTSGSKLEVGGSNMKIVFDLATGRMESFNYKGKELLKKLLNLISGDHLLITIMAITWIRN